MSIVTTLPVILAAGMGTRLQDQNKDLPKALLEIKGECLINFQLQKLQRMGFESVVIVTGFKSPEIKRKIGDNFLGMRIEYINNDKFSHSGTAFSLFQVMEFWSAKQDSILMLHGDLFYDTSILDVLFEKPSDSTIVTDYDFQTITNDEMVVFSNENRVTKIVKGPSEFKNAVGESLGINLFSSSFCTRYFLYLTMFFKDTANLQTHWEQTIEGFLCENEDLVTLHTGIDSKLWVNINYPDDLNYASNDMYQQLNN